MSPKTKREAEKPYTLTKKDAWSLLAAASNYAHTPDRTINGKDRADVLAEATLATGRSYLSETISGIHSSVMGFHKGDYKAIQFLLETPAIRESLMDDPKGNSFAPAVEHLFNPLRCIADLEDKLRGRPIDWDASSKVLLKVKSEQFPEELTMIEKLAVADKSRGARSK